MFLLKYDTELLKWVSLWLYCKNVNQKEKVWKMYWAGTFIIAIYMVISKSIVIVLMCFLNSIPILLLRFFKIMCSEVTDKSQISATNGLLNIQSKPLEINSGGKWKWPSSL